MQTFRFRLARVLEWYTRQFQEEERRYTACLAAVAEAHRAIAAFQAERLAIENDVVSRVSIPAREFVALGLYRLGAKKREVELNEIKAQRQQAAKLQLQTLQLAQRKMRLLEKLRERRLTEHEYAETRELEELASDAFFAKWAAEGQ